MANTINAGFSTSRHKTNRQEVIPILTARKDENSTESNVARHGLGAP